MYMLNKLKQMRISKIVHTSLFKYFLLCFLFKDFTREVYIMISSCIKKVSKENCIISKMGVVLFTNLIHRNADGLQKL